MLKTEQFRSHESSSYTISLKGKSKCLEAEMKSNLEKIRELETSESALPTCVKEMQIPLDYATHQLLSEKPSWKKI